MEPLQRRAAVTEFLFGGVFLHSGSRFFEGPGRLLQGHIIGNPKAQNPNTWADSSRTLVDVWVKACQNGSPSAQSSSWVLWPSIGIASAAARLFLRETLSRGQNNRHTATSLSTDEVLQPIDQNKMLPRRQRNLSHQPGSLLALASTQSSDCRSCLARALSGVNLHSDSRPEIC